MIKKLGKMLCALSCAFFISLTPAFAREMTLDELAEEVKEVNPDATYVYVIGEYVYTSSHILTTQDTMLAARTIKVTNEAKDYDAMTIIELDATYDEDWNLDGFEYSTAIVGTAEAQETYDIQYIDYAGVREVYSVETLVDISVSAVDNAYTNPEDSTNIRYGLTGRTAKVAETRGTGLITALKNILDNEEVDSIVLNYNGESYTFDEATLSDLQVSYETLAALVAEMSGKDFTEATQEDLAGKEFTMVVILSDGYVSENGITAEEYTVTLEEAWTYEIADAETFASVIENLHDGDILVLSDDINLEDAIEIAEGMNITIDLNGKTLTTEIDNSGDLTIVNGSIQGGTNAIYGSGNLTLTDVNVSATGQTITMSDGGNLYMTGGTVSSTTATAIAVLKDSSAVIDGVKITSQQMAIGANATMPWEKVEIKNSTLIATAEPAIFMPGTSLGGVIPELVITNSTLSGISGIDARSGKITITDSSITATGSVSDWEYVKSHDTSSGTTDGSAALYLHSQYKYNNGGTLEVILSNTTLANVNNTYGPIRVYEHGSIGVETIDITTDTDYKIANELKGQVTLIINGEEVNYITE